MSSIQFTSLTSVLLDAQNQVFVDACNNDQYLYNMLLKEGPSSPSGSVWQFINARPTAAAFVEGGVFKSPDKFTQAKAELPPGYIHQVLSMTGKTQDALRNSSALQVANWLMKQYKVGAESMINLIEEGIYGGTMSGGEFVGLATAIDDGNTYAGVDRSTESKFRAFTDDNGGTPRALTMALLHTVYTGLTQTNRGKFTHIFASPTQCNAWRALAADVQRLGGQVQVTGNVYEQVNGVGTQIFGNSGIWFHGIQVTEIPGYPTDRIDFIDLSPANISLEVFRPFTVAPAERINDDMVWDMTMALSMPLREPRKGAARLGALS